MISGLLFVALVGCGTPVERSPGDPDASFPHPEGYPTHGTESLADLGSCVACHATDASFRAAPGCQSCHATYPHAPSIVQGAVHGASWQSEDAGCRDCHGEAGERAPAGVEGATCASCHHAYPHDGAYLDRHGAEVVARGGAAACASCHPAQGGPEEGRCADCHAAYPHPDAWRATEAHERVVDDSCTTCHEATGANRTDVPVCTQCHDLYPHPESDVWRTGHIDPVQTRGEASCRSCHPAGQPSGPDLPVSCAASCHTPGEAK